MTDVPIIPFEVFFKEVTSSTMDDAREYILSGKKNKAIFIADHQEKGRGRRGNLWEAEADAIMVTCAIPSAQIHIETNLITLAAGLSVLQSVDAYAKSFFCKWPNDIVDSEGKKLAGILAETNRNANDPAAWTTIGVGLNMKTSPDFATCLMRHTEKLPDKNKLIHEIASTIFLSLMLGDSATIIEELNHRLYRPVSTQQFQFEGKSLDINVQGVAKDGALVATEGGKAHSFVTGHFLRKTE